jgi:hypothetical protein
VPDWTVATRPQPKTTKAAQQWGGKIFQQKVRKEKMM